MQNTMVAVSCCTHGAAHAEWPRAFFLTAVLILSQRRRKQLSNSGACGRAHGTSGCKRSSRQRGPHGAPSDTHTARGPMRPVSGNRGRTLACRVASKSPHVYSSMCSSAQRSSLQELARGVSDSHSPPDPHLMMPIQCTDSQTLVAVLLLRRPMHARRGAESLLSDCSVLRWLPYHSAAANTVWRVKWASSTWHFVAARGPHGNEVLTERPRTLREGPCARVQLRATTWLQPRKASRLRESGAAPGTPCRVASKSPRVTRRDVFKIKSSHRGPHCKRSSHGVCHTVALAITTNGGISEVRPNDPIYQTHNNDHVLLTAKPSFSNPSACERGIAMGPKERYS